MKAAQLEVGKFYAYEKTGSGIGEGRAWKVEVLDNRLDYANADRAIKMGSEVFYGTEVPHGRAALKYNRILVRLETRQDKPATLRTKPPRYRAALPQEITMPWDQWEKVAAEIKEVEARKKAEREAHERRLAERCEDQTRRLKALGLVEGVEFKQAEGRYHSTAEQAEHDKSNVILLAQGWDKLLALAKR
jgi:hypothetical protein